MTNFFASCELLCEECGKVLVTNFKPIFPGKRLSEFLPQKISTTHQEWPRQTKPKKGQFMNFSQGHSGTKVQCESCLLSQGKTPEFTKMREIHELFVLAFLVWFAGATPEHISLSKFSNFITLNFWERFCTIISVERVFRGCSRRSASSRARACGLLRSLVTWQSRLGQVRCGDAQRKYAIPVYRKNGSEAAQTQWIGPRDFLAR